MANRLIGVDWGSTNLRAYLFSAQGKVEDTLHGTAIIMDHADGLMRFLEPWRATSLSAPILICGMAGARGGWMEVPYVPVPAGFDALSTHVVTPPDCAAALIVPGISRRSAGRTDVMRGEEIQALGSGIADGLIIAPGTHSKWITISESRIVDLRTFVTGEMYSAMLGLRSLSGIADGEAFDREAFLDGVARAGEGSNLLELVFALRADVLMAGFPERAVAARLSGMLIGSELQAARKLITMPAQPALVCEPALADIYMLAFAHLGLPEPLRLDPIETTARGLWALHLVSQKRILS